MECTIFKADGLFKETSEIVAVQTPYGPINHTLRFNAEIHEIIDAKPPKLPGARWNRVRLDWDYPPYGTAVELDAALDQALAADNSRVDVFSGEEDITEKQALEAQLAQREEELAFANERIAELESREPEVRIERVEVERVVPVSSPEAAGVKIVPDELGQLMQEGESLSSAKRRLTELLWVEQAELRNLRGTDRENLKREAEIERLLGLFARLGEI